MRRQTMALGIVGTVLVGAAIVAWWPEPAEAPPGPPSGDREAPSSRDLPAPAPSRPRALPDPAARKRVLEQILRARRERALEPSEDADTPAPPLPPEAKAYGRSALDVDIRHMVDDCYEESGARERGSQGSLMTTVIFVGEPEIGAVIEHVEIGQDTEGLDDPALVECVQHSLAGLVLPAPAAPLRGAVEQRFRFRPPRQSAAGRGAALGGTPPSETDEPPPR